MQEKKGETRDSTSEVCNEEPSYGVCGSEKHSAKAPDSRAEYKPPTLRRRSLKTLSNTAQTSIAL